MVAGDETRSVNLLDWLKVLEWLLLAWLSGGMWHCYFNASLFQRSLRSRCLCIKKYASNDCVGNNNNNRPVSLPTEGLHYLHRNATDFFETSMSSSVIDIGSESLKTS